MIAQIPESVERPSADMMNKNITRLYKDQLSRIGRIEKRKQSKIRKQKMRDLKKAS